MTVGTTGFNGNFPRLRAIIETGEEVSPIQTSFPAEGLLRQDNFVSLLYYLGLLSFAGEREGAPLLKIANRTVRQLMYGYLRAAYDEVGVFRASTYTIAEKLRFMAYRIVLLYSGWELVHREAVAL